MTPPLPPAPFAYEPFRRRVYRLVAAIPPGRVATYGQLAVLAGWPRRARMAGRALREAPRTGPDGRPLPWHRVVNAQGRISARGDHRRGDAESPERRQRRLLEAEGVVFRGGRIDLAQWQWRPEAEGGALLAEAWDDA